MITCKELTAFLDDYLANNLPANKRRNFDEHLAVCPTCVRYLDQYKRAVELGQKAFADESAEVPAAVPDALLRAILAARPSTK